MPSLVCNLRPLPSPMSSVMLGWRLQKSVILWLFNITLDVILGLRLTSHIFSDISWRKFLFSPSTWTVLGHLKPRFSLLLSEQYSYRNKKLLEYCLITLSIKVNIYNWRSQIPAEFFLFLLAILTKILLEDECQRLKKSNLVTRHTNIPEQ